MDRMNSLDAVFIAIEDSVNHMHIGSVGIFDGPSPAFEDVRALVASKLHLVPRYRQRVREAPVSIGRPLWIDDRSFDLDYHVRHTSLAEGEPDALEHLVGRVMSQPLDRHRPLWEMWMIEGVGEGRWALLSKVHHCMVDGIAGSDLMSVVLDLEPDAPRLEPQAWEPAPAPSRLDLARYSAEMAIESATGFARGGFDVVRHPTRAAERARDIVAGLGRIVSPAMGGGAEAILGPIGPHRRWVRTRVSLDDVKRIRVAFGGTVNDVVLAAVTRGFRELLKARGALDGTITTLIPVSTRAPTRTACSTTGCRPSTPDFRLPSKTRSTRSRRCTRRWTS